MMDQLLWIKKKLEKGDDDNIYNDDSAASATLRN